MVLRLLVDEGTEEARHLLDLLRHDFLLVLQFAQFPSQHLGFR